MTKAIDILSMGEPMVEFNQTREGGGATFLRGCGGDSSNFAVAAARQGARVGYVSAVGNDSNGLLLREMWRAEGVDDTCVRTDEEAPTGVYFVSHGEGGHRFDFCRTGSAASRCKAGDLPLEAIARAKVLHLSGISLAISASACDAGYRAIEHARTNNVMVSFDTNLRRKLWPLGRARAIIWDVISLSDICLPSYDDVVQLSDLSDPDAIVDRCLSSGAKIVALKLGSSGALVADANERHRIAPYPCQAVDATGAGDTFGGAFVARIVAGDDIAAAGRYAAAAAALSTEGYGAVTPIPTSHQVRALLSRHEAVASGATA
ncbi:MAG: sugar kinase [Proteobacteria bacterium]|nr:sugar kinase [Pseudomonadota bacterium]